MRGLTNIRIFLFWFLSFGVALGSMRFLSGGVEQTMEFVAYHAVERKLAFFAHITLGPLALVLTPFQFSTRLRAARPKLHRWMGRIYGLAILLAGTGGLLMAINTQAGTMASLGFAGLALAWLSTTAIAIWYAVNRRIGLHQRWIMRSAALTLSAVTLRLWLPLMGATIGFEVGYPYVAWLCWVPNLLVAEWLLRRRRVRAAQPI